MLTRSDDLDILLMVVDSGGFSAAADAMDIQVARVSRAVNKIEQQLGVTILNRTTRRVMLTDEGRQFVESVRAGLQQLQRAEDELVSRGELPQGRLRVDAASPFLIHQLVPLTKEFRTVYPDIQLELTSNEGYVDLLEQRTDVAIRIGKLDDSTLHVRPLGKSALHIVAAPDYLASRGVPLTVSELAEHDLLGFSDLKALNQWPLKGSEPITPTIGVSNGEMLRQLAIAGNGISCLSGFMVNEDIVEGLLVPLLEAERMVIAEREQVNAVYYKSSNVARRVSAFIEFIRPRLSL
jgi:DNA-binding transcriptional LysR family regulator